MASTPPLQINNYWPHRCWFNEAIPTNNLSWLQALPQSTLIPILPIINNMDDLPNSKLKFTAMQQSFLEKKLVSLKWQCVLEQTAMYINLSNNNEDDKYTQIEKIQPRKGFSVKAVKSPEELTSWLNIVTHAFGYCIDQGVIEKLINDPEIKIFTAHYNDQAIASALLYKTGNIIGLHQVGVNPNVQGQGFARTFMQEIITICQLWQGQHIVLQASQAGKPLYERLGFTSQFLIRSYQTTKIDNLN
jgi:ribosomal protein S18 acetylase RimI-like enzyme